MSDEEHVKELDKKARTLENDLEKISEQVDDDIEEYLSIIQNQGFTTPIDFMFSNLTLDTLIAQLNTFADLERKFMEASRIISKGAGTA